MKTICFMRFKAFVCFVFFIYERVLFRIYVMHYNNFINKHIGFVNKYFGGAIMLHLTVTYKVAL